MYLTNNSVDEIIWSRADIIISWNSMFSKQMPIHHQTLGLQEWAIAMYLNAFPKILCLNKSLNL